MPGVPDPGPRAPGRGVRAARRESAAPSGRLIAAALSLGLLGIGAPAAPGPVDGLRDPGHAPPGARGIGSGVSASAPREAPVADSASAHCAPLEVRGDAIPEPLLGLTGDPARGRRVAMAREGGDCTLCHRLPLPGRRFHGTVGPPLGAVGTRLTPGQLRLRIAAGRLLMPASVMPEYCRVGDRHRVAGPWQGAPVLTAQQIEDLVAWLGTLDGKAPPEGVTGGDG